MSLLTTAKLVHHSFLINVDGLEIDSNKRHSFVGCNFEFLKMKVMSTTWRDFASLRKACYWLKVCHPYFYGVIISDSWFQAILELLGEDFFLGKMGDSVLPRKYSIQENTQYCFLSRWLRNKDGPNIFAANRQNKISTKLLRVQIRDKFAYTNPFLMKVVQTVYPWNG